MADETSVNTHNPWSIVQKPDAGWGLVVLRGRGVGGWDALSPTHSTPLHLSPVWNVVVLANQRVLYKQEQQTEEQQNRGIWNLGRQFCEEFPY